MTSKKKKDLIHRGSRVRIANPEFAGAERWLNARLGTVVAPPKDGGVNVIVDDREQTLYVPWCDVDVEQKPRHTWLDLSLILVKPSRWQYRQRFDPDGLLELAQSIQQHGLVNRLLVFKHEDGEHYELIAGERRLRALWALALSTGEGANLSGAIQMTAAREWWEELCVWDDTGDTAACELRDGDAPMFREIVILENLQREDPSPVEEAEAYRQLLDAGYTQTTLARRLSKSQGYISQRLGLLGLAAGVRGVVADGEISFSAARAIATLPEAVQGAVTAHVQDLAAREGESAATTRKVQAMTRQIKAFLDPENWDPPADQVLDPATRNRLRLMRHSVETLDPAEAGEAVLRLRETERYGAHNYAGKKPLTVAGDSSTAGTVLRKLMNVGGVWDWDVDRFWRGAAGDHGWTCKRCQFAQARKPEMFGAATLCARWGGEEVDTCLHYIGPDDPVVLPLRDTGGYLDKVLDGRDLPKLDRGTPYLVDLEAFVQVLEDLAVHRADAQAAAERKRSQAHLPQMMEYWAAQAMCYPDGAMVDVMDSPFGLGLVHAQAHRCMDCAWLRADLLEQALPPCHFATEPQVTSAWNATPRAPAMGILVREDGLMVPRCEMFRYRDLPEIGRIEGVRFGEARTVAMAWLHEIAKAGPANDHHDTMVGPLAWLPYDRDGRHDLNAMVAWVRNAWDGGDLDDEQVAHLVNVALADARARQAYKNPFTLRDADSGKVATWCATGWERFAAGEPAVDWQWPEGWPMPWVAAADDQSGGERR